MRKAKEWLPKYRIYIGYDLPEKATLFSEDVEEEIQCARCSKEMLYGEGYTSKLIHGGMGFGYSVCAECYQKEWEIEKDKGE